MMQSGQTMENMLLLPRTVVDKHRPQFLSMSWIHQDLSKTPVLAVDPIEKPGEPTDFHISEIGKTFCFLKWKKPDYDGGSRNLGYHVEKKPKEAEEWERLHKGAIKETHFMADRCIENQIYQFRVQTKNEGGESNWVTTAETLVKELLVEPEIKIKLDGTLVVKAGDSIPIECTLTGSSPMDVVWHKDNIAVSSEGIYVIKCERNKYSLHIKSLELTDAGVFLCKASNSVGTATFTTELKVINKPNFVKTIEPVSAAINDLLRLESQVDEDTGVTVTWTRDGKKVHQTPDLCQENGS
uniref:Uncharacterized protein n=1 Tax=Echeneis naucrates TaxID=173247 RepID=A0A665TCI0_ECHNA